MKFRVPFLSQKFDREMSDEMAFHIESKTRELVEGGMSETDARLEARRRFGSVLKQKEAGHEIRTGRFFEDVLRDDEIVQVTTDHSVVQELIAAGRLSPEEAENHPYGNVITRAVGPSETVKPDYLRLDVLDGDRFVICSDGLTKELTDFGIRHFLEANADPAAAVEAMMAAALENGGRDNITIVVLDVARRSA